ncbi:MAG: methylenetetrahydrofolate reductase [Planctomycetes bacterium]|nr:methylenetetrahydrofolate reductase [Planctomycetota bacterium]
MSATTPARRPSAVLFEEVPPLAGDESEHAAHLDRIERILAASRIDGIALPEIREEVRDDKTIIAGKARVDVLAYAGELRRRFGVRVLPYRVVCGEDRDRQANVDWFARCRAAGIDEAVLVGAQSNTATYPCGILEMNAAATELGLRVGNILIPSREDEARRVRSKVEAGARFFTTQVLFEAEETLAVLRSLAAEPPPVAPTIYLCFSPLSRLPHLRFAESIGCTLPPAFRKRARAAGRDGSGMDEICVAAIHAAWNAIAARPAEGAGATACEVGLLIGDLGRKSSHASAEGLLRAFAPARPAATLEGPSR